MYLPQLSKAPHIELVSVCDTNPERAAAQVKKFNVPNQYPHLDQLLAGAAFDMMVNLTNMQEHGRFNKQALEAGKNIWCEKPMANTYAEGKDLLDLARHKNRAFVAPLRLLTVHNLLSSRAPSRMADWESLRLHMHIVGTPAQPWRPSFRRKAATAFRALVFIISKHFQGCWAR
jgi:predicted dehydrogenase